MKKRLLVLLVVGTVLAWVFATSWLRRQDIDPSVNSHSFTTQDLKSGDGTVDQPFEPPSQPVAASLDHLDSKAHDTSELFSEVNLRTLDQNVLDEFLNLRPVVRFRAVTVNADAFRTIIRDAPKSSNISVRLFDDVVLPLVTLQGHEYVDGQFSGYSTLIARPSNETSSLAQVMVDPAGMVEASFRSSAGVFRIEGLGQSGYHIIWQRDPTIYTVTD